MSTSYNTHPPPTAAITIHTTDGPIPVELFAKQTPLSSRAFLQNCVDGLYDGTAFWRVVKGFIVQGGRPGPPEPATGATALRPEPHPRLTFSHRGLLGLVPGSNQFFFTLAPTPELTNKNTLIGRVAGDGVYTVLKLAERDFEDESAAADGDGDDAGRVLYPARVTRIEVESSPFELVPARPAPPANTAAGEQGRKPEKRAKKTKGKARVGLSFADSDDEAVGMSLGQATALADAKRRKDEKKARKEEKREKKKKRKEEKGEEGEEEEEEEGTREKRGLDDGAADEPMPDTPPSRAEKGSDRPPKRARRSPSPAPSCRRPSSPAQHSPPTHPPKHEPAARPPSSSSSSSSPKKAAGDEPGPRTKPARDRPDRDSKLASTRASIAALKASMRPDRAGESGSEADQSAGEEDLLAAMIPATAIRGRKRGGAGSGTGTGTGNDNNKTAPASSGLGMFMNFKKMLEEKDSVLSPTPAGKNKGQTSSPAPDPAGGEQAGQRQDKEEKACSLHFLTNCLSCNAYSDSGSDDETDLSWMNHRLTFTKDRETRAEEWKAQNDDFTVIDTKMGNNKDWKRSSKINGDKEKRPKRW